MESLHRPGGRDPLKLSYEPILGKRLKSQGGGSTMNGAQDKHWGLFLMARPLVKEADMERVTQNSLLAAPTASLARMCWVILASHALSLQARLCLEAGIWPPYLPGGW